MTTFLTPSSKSGAAFNTSDINSSPRGIKSSLVLFAAMAVLNLFVSASVCAQSKKSKKLAAVTFQDEYTRKANDDADKAAALHTQEEYNQSILANVGTIVAPVYVKREDYTETLADGSLHIVRFHDNDAIGDHVRLIKTDADGIIEWERNFFGDGFSGERDNFMKHTKDGGYLIQQTICVGKAIPGHVLATN